MPCIALGKGAKTSQIQAPQQDCKKTHPSAHRQTALPRTRETPWEAAHVPGDLPVKAVCVQGGRLNPGLALKGYCTELKGVGVFDERVVAEKLSSALLQG